MSYDDIKRLEPAIEEIEVNIQLAGRVPDFWQGWEAIKAKLNTLVGWNRPKPDALSSSGAYDTVYHALYDIFSEVNREQDQPMTCSQ